MIKYHQSLSTSKHLFLFTIFIILFAILVPSLSQQQECTFKSQRSKCGRLSCNASSGTCVECKTSDDCYIPAMGCKFDSTVGENQCKLKSVQEYADENNVGALIGGILIAIFTVTIGVIAGVGGGGVMVGLFKVTLGLALSDAVALSLASIVGQGINNVFIQARRNHPKFHPPGPTRPLINYQLIVLFTPPTLAGVMYGNLIGTVIPDVIRLFSMAIFFVYILQRSIRKVIAQRQKDLDKAPANNTNNDSSSNNEPVDNDNDENIINNSTNDETKTDDDGEGPPIKVVSNQEEQDVQSSDDNKNSSTTHHSATASSSSSLSPQPHPDSHEQYPLKTYGLILLVFIPVLAANTLRSVVFPCDESVAGFWVTLVISSVYCLIFFLVYRSSLSRLADQDADRKKLSSGEHTINSEEDEGTTTIPDGETKSTKIEDNEDEEESEMQVEEYNDNSNPNTYDSSRDLLSFEWNTKSSVLFPIVGFFTGCFSSLFGIGGGMVLNILFIEVHLTAEEVSATGGCATFVIALLSLLQFIVQGNARYDYSLIFIAAGLCATLIGQNIAMPIIVRNGWNFMIILCLVIIIFGSLVVSLGVGISDAIIQIEDSGVGAIEFTSYCP